MLRNSYSLKMGTPLSFLNEVLSLNAQECRRPNQAALTTDAILNEVLSLNAQESKLAAHHLINSSSSMKS